MNKFMPKELVRFFKFVTGQDIVAEDYKELWADVSKDGEGMPQERLCAVQVNDGLWDIVPQKKQDAYFYGAPLLTSPFNYRASGDAVAKNITTPEMLRVLRECDPSRLDLPEHISSISA